MQRERPQHQPAVIHFKQPMSHRAGCPTSRLNVIRRPPHPGLQAKIRAADSPYVYTLPVDAIKHAAQQRIVHTRRGRAIERHAVHELDERSLDVRHIAVAVHVFAIEVGHHRQHRRQLQKRAVALVGFGHQVLRRAQPRVRPQRADASAHHHGWVQIALATARAQHRGDHRGRGRLAMHSGYGDPILQPHQFGQHLGALDHRNLAHPCFHHFGVSGGNSRTGHHHIRSCRVLRRVPFVDDRAHPGQPVSDRRAAQVGARHRIPHRQQNLRDSAHANPADADKMDPLRRFEEEVPGQEHINSIYQRRRSSPGATCAPPRAEFPQFRSCRSR